MPRGHGDDVLDLDARLSLVGERLIPNLRNERFFARRAYQVGVQVDSIPILLEEYSNHRSEDGLGRRLHVVTCSRGPRLRSAFGPGYVAFADNVALVHDDERTAMTGRHGTSGRPERTTLTLAAPTPTPASNCLLVRRRPPAKSLLPLLAMTDSLREVVMADPSSATRPRHVHQPTIR